MTPTAGAVAKLQDDIASVVPDAEFVASGGKVNDDGDFWYLGITYETPDLGKVTGIWGSLQDITTDEDPAFVAVTETAEVSGTYKQPVDFDGVTTSAVDMDDCIVG
ncbi:hypothetical protein JNB62_05440 [Microbacterium jejuense]|uniref:Uncharacterized protein n=1 Tax=Microbacterium jejuense TaxID=1263637 RepID=A0ABS7HKZ2_9MICO|nr:hypothetical protein [Microbacterium jejuense]MBW9093119.1 hypothetical protein [Microbacterium jejuense]